MAMDQMISVGSCISQVESKKNVCSGGKLVILKPERNDDRHPRQGVETDRRVAELLYHTAQCLPRLDKTLFILPVFSCHDIERQSVRTDRKDITAPDVLELDRPPCAGDVLGAYQIPEDRKPEKVPELARSTSLPRDELEIFLSCGETKKSIPNDVIIYPEEVVS